MNTRNFRTKQEFKNISNPKGKDFIIGLDVGYSSVKVFYENGYFCFPSYIKKMTDMMDLPDDKDILYRDDETNEIYMVGYVAQNMVESTDTNDSMGELAVRKIYNHKHYKIKCNVAIALATMFKNDDRKIIIQTGLPASYVGGDEPLIKKAISKPASFSIKKGKGKWKKFNTVIDEKNIFVMPQPAGSLYSTIIQNDGKYTNNAKQFLSSNVLIMDIGFGTIDFFGMKNRANVCKETSDEVGMRAVMSTLSEDILNEYGEDIRITALQKNLESGTVTCIDEDEMSDEEKPLEPLLEKANASIFKKAMEKAKNVTDAFRGYKYVIVAGGTGEAWFLDIKEWLSKRRTIKVLPSNLNDHLPFIYSNVRGYYMFRYVNNKHKE